MAQAPKKPPVNPPPPPELDDDAEDAKLLNFQQLDDEDDVQAAPSLEDQGDNEGDFVCFSFSSF